MSNPPEQFDFATTQWSIVLRAAQPDDSTARAALEMLCRRYWFPLYAFARRRVATVSEAQDLTQEFFLRLLEKNSLAAATPERGRFRSFLLTSLKNFLANEWDRANAQKRGGGREPLSLDWETGESRLSFEPTHTDTAEREFERRWALTLLDVVVKRLQDEFATADKSRQFELLKETLTGGRAALDHAAIASKLRRPSRVPMKSMTRSAGCSMRWGRDVWRKRLACDGSHASRVRHRRNLKNPVSQRFAIALETNRICPHQETRHERTATLPAMRC